MSRPEIHPAALTHGITEEVIRYVYAHPNWVFTDQGDWELTMHVGVTQNGAAVIEVGFDTVEDEGDVVIVHAMHVSKQRARERYGL